jgi:hypothetical protein
MSNMSEYLQGLPPAQQRQLKEQVTAAVLAVDLCRRCVATPGPQSNTVPHLRQYVHQAVTALQAVEVTLPREA